MWYVLKCREGQEETILRSCRQHLSGEALTEAFLFRCERLWKSGGIWKRVEKDMFPGYVFLESSRPDLLSRELDQYRPILTVLEEDGYLISVYQDEEESLRALCGNRHFLPLSYGYKKDGIDHITEGPLRDMGGMIRKVDWHKRYAQVEIPIARKNALVWAGVGLDQKWIQRERETLVS